MPKAARAYLQGMQEGMQATCRCDPALHTCPRLPGVAQSISTVEACAWSDQQEPGQVPPAPRRLQDTYLKAWTRLRSANS